MMQSVEATLRMVPGFAELDTEDLERVAEIGGFTEVRQGAVLLREGAMPEWLYVLLKGRVSLTGTATGSATGSSSTVIDILGPASSFVVTNVLTDEPYVVGAAAVGSSLLIRI